MTGMGMSRWKNANHTANTLQYAAFALINLLIWLAQAVNF